jgi:hypothetical protein
METGAVRIRKFSIEKKRKRVKMDKLNTLWGCEGVKGMTARGTGFVSEREMAEKELDVKRIAG